MRLFIMLLTMGLFYSLPAYAQTPNYPKNYFRWPVDIAPQIQANMGELRNNHWHMGLDVRTNAKENYAVFAAAQGYIAAIGVRPGSFGRFIVINHPNGLSTLYAHLNDFYPKLEQYVRSEQSKTESWAIELTFSPNQFPVVKGDFIAYSGNTGGSQGPHVHFEIFDTKTEKRLNPLLFGFSLTDNIAPTIFKLAMYDRSKSVYEQKPDFFSIKKTDSGYILSKKTEIRTHLTKISFAIQAVDRMNSSGSDDGIYSAQINVDNLPLVKFVIDSISYAETRYMNAQIDYKYHYNGGGWLQHLSRMPGDFGGAYKELAGDGVINLNDTVPHFVSIKVADAYGNASHLDFMIRHDDSLKVDEDDNDEHYHNEVFAPAKENKVQKSSFEAQLPFYCIYDTVPVWYAQTGSAGYNAVSDAFSIGDAVCPVQDAIKVSVKNSRSITDDQQSNLVIVRKERKKTEIKKAIWENGWISAEFRDFGNYQAFLDLTPPAINTPGKGDTINLSAASRIVFTPTDNYKVKDLKVYLYACASDSNGYHCNEDALGEKRWLRFTNDKGRNWIYHFDENLPFGVYKLQAIVTDLVDNTTTRSWWIKRSKYTPQPPKKKITKKPAGKKTTDTKKKSSDNKKTSTKKTGTKKSTKKK